MEIDESEKLLCLTVSLPWQNLLWTKGVCERRPDFDRFHLVYARMQIVNVCSEDSIFCVTSILVSQIVYIRMNESLAADALNAVRSRGNVSTSQLARKWRQNDGDKNF